MIERGGPDAFLDPWFVGYPMAQLWQRDEANDRWTPTPLEAEATLAGGAASLLRARTPDGACWIVLAGEAIQVNGSPLGAGIAVLGDRDEIRIGPERAFFSTERLATVTIYPGGEHAVFCPRCKLEIAAGTPVVRCPSCNVLHHQSDEYPCWTYAERCALCDQPTALDAGFRWTPEEL
jgi:hypothetical protein